MAARLKGIPDWQFQNSTGTGPAAGGKVHFYVPGTTTYKDIYDGTDKQTTLTNPVTLNGAGRVPFPVYTEGFYDVLITSLENGNQVTIDTIDNWGDDWSAVGTDLSENLVSNASAETAGSSEPFENWTETDSGTVITRDTTDSYHGTASFLFTNSQNGADYVTSDAFEVSPGKDLALSFFVKASNANAEPKVQINWLTGAQASISTSTVYDDNVGLTPTSWTLKQGFRATPPSTARYAKLILVGNDNATQYTTRFDGIYVRAISRFPDEAPNAPQGLELSIDSGDTDHDINVTAGTVKSDDYTDDIILTTEITKQIDASWSAGDDQGGLESGSALPTDDLVYVWVIKNSSTGHVDVLISLSATSPTMPSGYDVKRYLGAVPINSSSNILANTIWKGRICACGSQMAADVNSSALSSDTYVEYALTAPPRCIVTILCSLQSLSSDYMGSAIVKIRHTTISADDYLRQGIDINGADVDNIVSTAYIILDDSSSVDITPFYSDTTTNPNLTVRVLGWDDLRRDNP